MSTEPSFSLEDYERLADEKAAQKKTIQRTHKLQAADSLQLLWTALLPSWTVPLAKASGFPVDDVDGYFRKLQERKIVNKSEVVESDEESRVTVYTMDEVARGDIINTYLETPTSSDKLKSTLGSIGSNILKTTVDKLSVASPAVARFAELAVNATDRAAIVTAFDDQVEAAFNNRDSGAIRDWMNTAMPFSALLTRLNDDSMKLALQRASQRLILLRREDNDLRHLKHFYQRDDQLKAFEDLMNADDSSWALHFLGGGGVGKTMLVRKITVEWANNYDAVAARVDFDYLKAEYPTLDPGMLLWAFAQELRAHANPDVIRKLNRAERKFEELSSRIQKEMTSGSRPRATDDPDFKEAVSDYSEALRLIGKRVVLIVDTCEELAKIGIGQTPVQNIHETFRILRALHDGPHTLTDESAEPRGGLPSLRVIFSGRRPLARAGANWECPDASHLDPRSFLRLHEVRGFTETEATLFLREKLKVDESLIPAIIKRSSPDTGSVAEIKWTGPVEKPTNGLRCNPYDLKLYADWSKEQPPPTAAQILATPPATQYVELRVLRRLHDEELREALPAVALLGHFDRSMLEHTFGNKKKPEQISRLFELLQQEEWINQRGVPDQVEGTNLILDVESGIRTRLFVYYKNNPLLNEVQSAAAKYLENLTLNGNPSRLDWSVFDAALTVLEADPDKNRVVRWWRALDSMMFAQCLPEWIKITTYRMQIEGGAAAFREPDAPPDVPPESRVRPAVLATYASALLRSTKLSDLKLTWRELNDVWSEVLTKGGALAEEMPELEMRARIGLISASLRNVEAAPTPELLAAFWRFLKGGVNSTDIASQREIGGYRGPRPYSSIDYSPDSQMLASVVAGIEAVIEFADATFRKDPFTALTLLRESPFSNNGHASLKEVFRGAATTIDLTPELRPLLAFYWCLIGRTESMLGQRDEAVKSFKEALSMCDSGLPEPSDGSRPWFDWLPPEDLASRIRLEFIRAASSYLISDRRALETVKPRASNTSVDNDRLSSAYLRLKAALGPISEKELTEFQGKLARASSDKQSYSDVGVAEAICRAHQVTPPLFITIDELRADIGETDSAFASLAAAMGSRSKINYETVLHIDRACTRMVLKYRLRDVGERGGQILISSSDVTDRALAWKLDAQDGARISQTLPRIPEALTNVEITEGYGPASAPQLEKLNWLNAIWQTRYAGDRASAEMALQWAEQNLRDYLANPARDSYELLSVQMDCFEAQDLAARYGRVISLGASARRLKRFEPLEFRSNPIFSPHEVLVLSLRASALLDRVVPISFMEDLARDSIGLRRAAEIVFHEADLLALRFPERAANLYHLAWLWFRDCGDLHGEFIAVTSEGMCLSPKDWKRLSPTSTEPSHKLLLPSAKQDPAVLIAERNQAMSDWTSRSWRPRFTRYLLLHVAESFKKDYAQIGREVIENYLPGAIARGSGKDDPDAYSADLATWLRNAEQPPGLLNLIWRGLKVVVQFILGLGVIFAAINFVFRGFRWGFSFVAPSFPTQNTWLQAATCAFSIITLSLAIRLALKVRKRKVAEAPEGEVSQESVSVAKEVEYPNWRIGLDFATICLLITAIIWPYYTEIINRFGWNVLVLGLMSAGIISLLYIFRGRFSQLSDAVGDSFLALGSFVMAQAMRLTLEVRLSRDEAVSTESDLTEVPELEIQLKPTLPYMPPVLQSFLSRRQQIILARLRVSGVQSYTEIEEALSGSSLLEEFRNLRRVVRPFAMAVQIEVEKGPANGICWESLLHLNTNSTRPDYTSLQGYRRLSKLSRHPPQRQQRIRLVLLAETVAALRLADSWRTTDANWARPEVANREDLILTLPEVSLVHLVGGLESSHRSVGFRLGEERAKLNAQSSKAISEADALIRPDDLVRTFPNLLMCIIQEEPRYLPPERFDGDRRYAFYARLFASQLSALGVACVLTIPPLEPDFALEVIGLLQNTLAHHTRLSRRTFLASIGKIRRKIAEHTSGLKVSETTKIELPQDLCLYLDTEWDGRLIGK